MRRSFGRRPPPAPGPESRKPSESQSSEATGLRAISGAKQPVPENSNPPTKKVSAELVLALAEENASLEFALDSLPDPVVWMDERCRIFRANRAAAESFGEGLSEILGRPCYEVIHGASAPPPDCPHRLMQTSGRAERGELSHPAQEKIFDIAALPYGFSPKGSRGCVAVLRDVTSRRSAEVVLRSECDQLAGRTRHLESRLQELSLLREMGDVLQVCTTREKTYEVLAHFASKLFGEDSGALRLHRPKKGLVETVAVWGPNPPSQKAFPPADCAAIESGRASDNIGGASLCRHVASSPATTMCLPIFGQGKTLGSLELVLAAPPLNSPGEIRSADSLRLRALTITEHFGRALVNLRILETLRGASVRDSLTGLFNRRYLDEALDREVRRADRTNRPLGVIMLDVDHFKLFNDAHGHAAGDLVLRSLGQMLRARTRQEDVVCRYGGEEFVMILPEAPLEVSRQRAEQLRDAALLMRVNHDGRLFDGVSLSLGVAAFPGHGTTAPELLASADRHLYDAKNAGRGQVVSGVTAASRES